MAFYVSVINDTQHREVTAAADVAVVLPEGRYLVTVTGADVYYTCAAAVAVAGLTRSAVIPNGWTRPLSLSQSPLRLRTAAGVADVHLTPIG